MAIATPTIITGTRPGGSPHEGARSAAARPGDIAVIDHRNLDRVAAEELIAARPAAVINAAPSADGTYPNLGPLILVRGGIPLIDVDAGLLERIADGDTVEVEGGAVACGELTSEGRSLEEEELLERLDQGRRRAARALREFAENTLDHLRDEAEGFLSLGELPEPAHEVPRARRADRRPRRRLTSTTSTRSLATSTGAIRSSSAVDGGADALIDRGLVPDLIVGDMDSATEAALRSGAELIVHGYPGGEAPGAARVAALGLRSLDRRGSGDQPGPRAADRLRTRGRAPRERRHAAVAGRVPGQGPRRDVLDLPRAAARRRLARRRERDQPARCERAHLACRAGPTTAAGRSSSRSARSCCSPPLRPSPRTRAAGSSSSPASAPSACSTTWRPARRAACEDTLARWFGDGSRPARSRRSAPSPSRRMRLADRGLSTSGTVAAVGVLTLAAHLGNLLDTRPGRSEKALALSAAAVCLASRSLVPLEPIAALLGPVAVGSWFTLRERAMLGDSGASLIGGMIGILLVTTLSVARSVVLARAPDRDLALWGVSLDLLRDRASSASRSTRLARQSRIEPTEAQRHPISLRYRRCRLVPR